MIRHNVILKRSLTFFCRKLQYTRSALQLKDTTNMEDKGSWISNYRTAELYKDTESKEIRTVNNEPGTKALMDYMCEELYYNHKPSKSTLDSLEVVRKRIQANLRQSFDSNTVLKLFGSSRNGLYLDGSDLDICAFFSQENLSRDMEQKLVHKIANVLKNCEGYSVAFPISRAKVPIIRFCYSPLNIGGDICFHNALGLRNTEMLKLYMDIDRRCLLLCYAMKILMKTCRFIGSGMGTLSSYACTLLVIYFLQQTDPPVLPVLQELYDVEKPIHMADGWNTWFYDDIDNLPDRWQGWRQNTESVGELWLKLLRFYCLFEYGNTVISIQHRKKTKCFGYYQKMKIQDPFELDRNLANRLRRNHLKNLQMIFMNSFSHFSSRPVGDSLEKYYFDQEILTHKTWRPAEISNNCYNRIIVFE